MTSRLQSGHTGARLNKAFQRAFNVAKAGSHETNIQRGSISVASVSVELAEKDFQFVCRANDVMVIGAGDTSEKTARALLSRGRKVSWSPIVIDRAEALGKNLVVAR